MMYFCVSLPLFFYQCYRDHLDPHVLTHSFPTRPSSYLAAATVAIARRTGLTHRPSTEGDYVSGVKRERVTLASGRFAMVDDGLGFQLAPWRPARSEEHTSELQSLMRISYAVFCLKKKKTNTIT